MAAPAPVEGPFGPFFAPTTPVAAPVAAPQAASFGSQPLHSNLSIFIVQVFLIIVIAKFLGWVLAKIKQPAVIAEVITGILLGPTVMGRVPNFTKNIFPTANMPIFSTFAEVGLVFFMNLVGLELNFGIMSTEWKSTALISAVGIALPMGVSVGSSYAVWDSIDKHFPSTKKKTFGTYVLFMAVAMSITAFPVLARIVKEKGLSKTRIGTMTLSVAAWDDVMAWILLALSISIVSGSGKYDALWTFLLLIGFALFMFFPVRIGLRKVLIKKDGNPRELTPLLFAAYILCTLACAWLTEYFGLHSIFGAFIFGLVVPRQRGFEQKVAERFEDFITTFFVPLYFTASGLKTQLGLLSDGNTWGLLLLIISIAITTKVAGGTLAARVMGMSWRESFTLGMLMNTKGLVELIVLNIGLDAKLISPTTFSMMVVMALVTTFLTSPFVHFLYPYHRVVAFENQTPGRTILFGLVRNRAAVQPFVGLMNLIVKGRPKKYKVFAAKAVSLPDRPSAYMTDDQRDEITQFTEDTGNTLGIRIKSSTAIGSESDVGMMATMSAAKNAHFAFSIWRPSQSDLEKEVEAVGEWTLGDSFTRGFSAHKSLKANMCVLLDRGFPATGSKIMFIYTGSHYDHEAIKLVRAMLHNEISTIEVVFAIDKRASHETLTQEKILHNDAILDSLFNTERPGKVSLTILQKSDLNDSLVSHILASTVDLVIVGSDLNWHMTAKEGIIHHQLVVKTEVSFLFVSSPHGSQKEHVSLDGSTTADTAESLLHDDDEHPMYNMSGQSHTSTTESE